MTVTRHLVKNSRTPDLSVGLNSKVHHEAKADRLSGKAQAWLLVKIRTMENDDN